MNNLLRSKRILGIVSIVIALAIGTSYFWPDQASASVQTSGLVSINLSQGISSGTDAYTTRVVSEKSPNYYEIDFPGTGGKIGIGNVSKSSNFTPDLTISSWDGEASFDLIAPANIEAQSQLTTALSQETITASNEAWAFEYKPVAPKAGFNEKGGIDITLTAKQKPVSNSIDFTFTSGTVTPYLQPALNLLYTDGWSDAFQADIKVSATQVINTKDGSVLVNRPDYVVNSIAFYANSKSGDMTARGGKNYRTGKVGNLYRLRATDSAGHVVWTDWKLTNGAITLTVPQSFLDSAAYPVTIAPVGDTFGYTTVGESQGSLYGNGLVLGFLSEALANTGTITSMSVYTYGVNSSQNIKYALYSEGTTSTLLGQTSPQSVGTAPSWVTASFISGVSVAQGSVYDMTTNGDGALEGYWDSVTGYYTNFAVDMPYAGGFISPETWLYFHGYPNYRFSIYCTYATSPSISNNPSSINFGPVYPGSTNSTGLNYFNVTNNSGSAVNISISGSDITGGTTWSLSDSATPGTATFGMKAGLNGGSYNIIVKKNGPFNLLKSNLAASTSQMWGLQLLAPTNYTDSAQKAGTVTLTATVP